MTISFHLNSATCEGKDEAGSHAEEADQRPENDDEPFQERG